MTVHRKRACLAVLLIVAICETAWADSGRTIAAVGSATVQRKPAHLRLCMQLTAKGKTLEDALAKMKERREAATAELESLKADKKSIVFGTPGMSNDQSSRKRQAAGLVSSALSRPPSLQQARVPLSRNRW